MERKKKRKKLKITQYKQYPLDQSPFYKLYDLARLFKLLNTSSVELEDVLNHPINSFYNIYLNKKGREIQETDKDKPLYKIHHSIAHHLTGIKLPEYIYSGKKGYDIEKNANAHKGNKTLLNIDISKFYPSTKRNKVFSFFYNELLCTQEIADILSTLCLLNNHVPTGSQISMPLVFWVNYKMFDELNLFATKHQLIMTVWVDDITFSGERIPYTLIPQLEKIIRSYGYKVNRKKTTLRHSTQTKSVTGVFINTEEKRPHSHYKKLRLAKEEWKKEVKNLNNSIEYMKKKKLQLLGLLDYSSHIESYKSQKNYIEQSYSNFVKAKTSSKK